jgi:D-alanine-D-alanine ligase
MNKQSYGKVAVLMGGRSAEREISLISGNAVLAALLESGVDAHAFDPAEKGLQSLIEESFARAFIILHGRYGEDGTIQGVLDYLDIPYTGSGVMASALAMDKWRTKLVWQATGIATPGFVLLDDTTDLAALPAALGLPLIIKPVNEGSTIGLSKVVRAEDLSAAYRLARQYDECVLAEQFIAGPEFTAAILGGSVLPLVRIEAKGGLYDYQAKYFSDDTRYFCPCGLSEAQENSIREQALRAFNVIGCRGWGRVDLMLDAQGEAYFLEVNTAPGMTGHSLVPMAAKQSGLSFAQLVMKILELARVG